MTRGRRRFLCALLGLAGAARVVRAAPTQDTGLVRAIVHIAPGIDRSCVARATTQVAARLHATAEGTRAPVARLLAQVAGEVDGGDEALARWRAAHPEAMRWLVAETFRALYGSRRHGGQALSG